MDRAKKSPKIAVTNFRTINYIYNNCKIAFEE